MEVASGQLVSIEEPAVDGPPPPIHPFHLVGDDDMGVELGVVGLAPGERERTRAGSLMHKLLTQMY